MKHKHFALKAVISVLIFAVLCMSVIFCINYGKSIRSQYFYTNTTDILGKNIDEVSEKTGIDFSIRGEFSSVTVRGYFQRNKKW